MLPAPKPVWCWPPAMMRMRDLFDALRAGFDLHMTHSERGQPIYQLSRDGIAAPIGILQQSIAAQAHRRGLLGHPMKLDDGRWLFKLTTKSARP